MSELYLPNITDHQRLDRGHWMLQDCVLWLPMCDGGGSTCFDWSGRGNNGTLTNMDPATDWVIGDTGRAIDFDGSNDTINVADSQSLKFGTDTDISYTCRLRTTSTATMIIYEKRKDAANSEQFGWFLSGGTVQSKIQDNNQRSALSGSTNIADGEWHTIVTTGCRSGFSRLYVDGVEDATAVNISFYGSIDTTNPLWIATREGSSLPFSGQLTDIRVFQRVLTQQEIRLLETNPWQAVNYRRKIFSVPAATAVTVTATTATVAASGVTASVSVGTSILATTANSSASGIAASVSVGASITTATATATATAVAASVSVGTTITASMATVAASGVAASVSAGTAIVAGTAASSATGVSAAVAVGTDITASTAAGSASGISASVSAGTSVTATTAASTVSGVAATVTAATAITATTASVSATPVSASVSASQTVTATTGTAAATGLAATVSAGTVIVATTAASQLSAIAASVSAGTTITATTAAAQAVGVTAAIIATVAVTATTASVRLAPLAATITFGGRIKRPHLLHGGRLSNDWGFRTGGAL
jgi:hypothetical protein